jgi:uncharacterized membrane protein
MNGAHLHLLLNHAPIYATAFGLLILLIGLIRKSKDIKNMGLLLFVIAALVMIPTFLSGKQAPRIVKELPGVTKSLIHNHAESAEVAFIAVGILGALSLLSLFLNLREGGTPPWLFVLCFLLSIFVSVSMAYTANLGGQIRHTEIRSDFIPPPPSPPGAPDHNDH